MKPATRSYPQLRLIVPMLPLSMATSPNFSWTSLSTISPQKPDFISVLYISLYIMTLFYDPFIKLVCLSVFLKCENRSGPQIDVNLQPGHRQNPFHQSRSMIQCSSPKFISSCFEQKKKTILACEKSPCVAL